MMQTHTQEAVHTIGRIRFIVTSNFKSTGRTAKENLSTLIQNKVEEKSQKIIDRAGKARYTNNV